MLSDALSRLSAGMTHSHVLSLPARTWLFTWQLFDAFCWPLASCLHHSVAPCQKHKNWRGQISFQDLERSRCRSNVLFDRESNKLTLDEASSSLLHDWRHAQTFNHYEENKNWSDKNRGIPKSIEPREQTKQLAPTRRHWHICIWSPWSVDNMKTVCHHKNWNFWICARIFSPDCTFVNPRAQKTCAVSVVWQMLLEARLNYFIVWAPALIARLPVWGRHEEFSGSVRPSGSSSAQILH